MIKKKSNKKAQTWSIDLVLGVAIFLLIVIVVYSLIASRPVSEERLREDADRIYSKLDSRSDKDDGVPKIIEGNSISSEELNNLYGETYKELKAKLGITHDFCIVIVTDNNEIISTENGTSIGNEKDIIIGNEIYCGN